MLTVIGAEVLRAAIPFRFGFRHSLAERKLGDSVLVTIRDAQGRRGHGECAPRDYVSGETSGSVLEALQPLITRWMTLGFASFGELVEALADEAEGLPRDEHAAFCALELAWLDLGGQVFGCSAGDPLGPVCSQRVEYSGVVSASGKDESRKICAAMKEAGVSSVKVKVGVDRELDLEVLRSVREVLGAGARLRIDVNAAWDAETALARLQELDDFRLEACEQPCPGDDFDGMAWLAARSPVPLVADESLVSLEDAQRLVELRACDIFNVRISKCGGLLGAGRIRDLGRSAGIDTMLGSHVGETAILAAAGRQFAARTPHLRFAEGSYGKLLLEADVSDAMDLGPGGWGSAIARDGLGLDVVLDRIEPFVVSRLELSA